MTTTVGAHTQGQLKVAILRDFLGKLPKNDASDTWDLCVKLVREFENWLAFVPTSQQRHDCMTIQDKWEQKWQTSHRRLIAILDHCFNNRLPERLLDVLWDKMMPHVAYFASGASRFLRGWYKNQLDHLDKMDSMDTLRSRSPGAPRRRSRSRSPDVHSQSRPRSRSRSRTPIRYQSGSSSPRSSSPSSASSSSSSSTLSSTQESKAVQSMQESHDLQHHRQRRQGRRPRGGVKERQRREVAAATAARESAAQHAGMQKDYSSTASLAPNFLPPSLPAKPVALTPLLTHQPMHGEVMSKGYSGPPYPMHYPVPPPSMYSASASFFHGLSIPHPITPPPPLSFTSPSASYYPPAPTPPSSQPVTQKWVPIDSQFRVPTAPPITFRIGVPPSSFSSSAIPAPQYQLSQQQHQQLPRQQQQQAASAI